MDIEFDGSPGAPRRRWGARRALVDDAEATSLLLSAVERCIISAGTVRFAMGDVAEEAGVARSTLYRYFPTRTDLITAFLVARGEARMAAVVASLREPDNATVSLPMFILKPVEDVRGTPLGTALFAPDSEVTVATIHRTDVLIDAIHRQLGPPLRRWQLDGQIHADLNLKMTTRWLVSQSVLLLSPFWQARPAAQRRNVVKQYIVRALLTR